MSFLPININIGDRKILMVGGGSVALHKLKNLSQYEPNLTVIAEEIHSDIQDMGYRCIEKKYASEDVVGFHLIYACTNNAEVNKQIKTDASKTGALVNVADDPENCDFISPAIFKTGELSISVSSGGTDVKKAVRWRNKIKTIIEQDSAWN